MARKPDIQYVNFYTDGSAARQPEPRHQPQPQPARAPRKEHKHKRYAIPVQPFALLGLAVSAVLLIMMISGAVELHKAQQERNRMEAYVQQLTERNLELTEMYESGYDLEEIERIALAIGMVPQEQVQQIHISVMPEKAPAQPTFWEKLAAIFRR